jgi:hypothetical protein
MLDLSHEQVGKCVSWDTVEATARLPEHMTNFFEMKGPLPARAGCRRAVPRFYMRGKAVLQLEDRYLGVYTVDTSRRGIRFISPIQLLPKLRVVLWVPNVKELQVEIVRCQRFGERCYDCGGVFVGEPAVVDSTN